MLTQHYSAHQRRALNQIWNAAGEYGFDPLFLALRSDGEVKITGAECVGKSYPNFFEDIESLRVK